MNEESDLFAKKKDQVVLKKDFNRVEFQKFSEFWNL